MEFVVVSTLLNFVKMFVRAHEENCRQLEFERKKAEKAVENEKLKTQKGQSEHLVQNPLKSSTIKWSIVIGSDLVDHQHNLSLHTSNIILFHGQRVVQGPRSKLIPEKARWTMTWRGKEYLSSIINKQSREWWLCMAGQMLKNQNR